MQTLPEIEKIIKDYLEVKARVSKATKAKMLDDKINKHAVDRAEIVGFHIEAGEEIIVSIEYQEPYSGSDEILIKLTDLD